MIEHLFDYSLLMFAQQIDDFVGMTPNELDAAVRELELERRRLDADMAAALAVVEQRKDHLRDRHRSLNAYAKATMNVSGSDAYWLRQRSRMMNAHPVIGERLRTGRIGVAQVDLLASAFSHPRAGYAFAGFVEQLLDHAEFLSHADLKIVVKSFIVRADTDGAFDEQRYRENEANATVSIVDDGIFVSATGGSPLEAEAMLTIFKRAVQDEFERDCETRRADYGDAAAEHPLPRTSKQRRFAALHAIFLAYATAPADGVAPEPVVNLVFSAALAGEALHQHGLVDSPDVFGPAAGDVADLVDQRCETSTGSPIHPDTALAAMLSGHVRRVVIDSASVVIDFGRTRRLFTGKAREAAQLLAVHCSHPGCDIAAEFCDVDHLEEWDRDGGSTDQANAGPMCGVHDRHKHRERLRARRATNGQIYLIRPDDTIMQPTGQSPPKWAKPVAQA